MIAYCVFILGTVEQFFKVGKPVEIYMFDVRISTSIKMHEIASRIVNFLHRSQILIGFMEWFLWQNEVRKKCCCNNFDFRSICFGDLFDTELAILTHLFQALVPELVDGVCLFLNFKIPSRIFRGEEEVFEDFIAVIKRRLDSDSANVVIDVELVK